MLRAKVLHSTLHSSPKPFLISRRCSFNSPYTRHLPGRLVIKGGPMPTLVRDTAAKEHLRTEMPKRAIEVISGIETAQERVMRNYENVAALRGQHVLLAGGTSGLGAALAVALQKVLGAEGSLTIVAADRDNVGFGEDLVMPFYFGELLANKNLHAGAAAGTRMSLINTGVALEGEKFGHITNALSAARAEKIIYINMVAAASSGLIPGADGSSPPPVYVRDILCHENERFVAEDLRPGHPTHEGQKHLMYWDLPVLNPKQIETTATVMGSLAIALPGALRTAGFTIGSENYSGWRGALNKQSRDPTSFRYGEEGSYSTSLFLPKDIIDNYVRLGQSPSVLAYHYFPTMKTRALGLIPGGIAMANIFRFLMAEGRERHIDVPELALNMLNYLGRSLTEAPIAKIIRYDGHESKFDHQAHEIMANLTDEVGAQFDFRKFLAA